MDCLRIALILAITSIFTTTQSFAQDLFDTPFNTSGGEAIYNALASDIRTPEERSRDKTRKPVETMEFFEFSSNMTVLELFPGKGWYTKILGKALEKQGQLDLAIGTKRAVSSLKQWGLEEVRDTGAGITMERDTNHPGYVFDLKNLNIGSVDVDLVLTFRNMHNLTSNARIATNQAVFKALKPGGIYGIIDHTARHMEPVAPETWRRVDPVLIIKEVLDAGFIFEAYSTIHSRSDDALIYDTTHPSLDRYSDRFTLKFRKPL